MKKISLMLCVCAMALVGLFVSCSNGEYIDSTSVGNNYLYKVTGTMKVIETEGLIDNPSSLTREYTIVKATGGLWWAESVSQAGDVPEYSIWTSSVKADLNTVTSSASAKTYNVTTYLPFNTLYKFGDDFYIKSQKGVYSKVTLNGEFGDDSFTIQYSYAIDNGSTSTSVDTTTYSGTLTFTDVTAE